MIWFCKRQRYRRLCAPGSMCGLLLNSHFEDHLLASLRLDGPPPVFASDAHKLAGYPDQTCELCAVWHDCT